MTGVMPGPRRGAAVLGSPVAHSLSPVLHRAAYADLGLAGWEYGLRECGEQELAATLHELDAAGLAGVSLTMPLKRAAVGLATRCDRVVTDTGVANTVLFGGLAGEWWAANTDVPGLVAVLRGAGLEDLAGARVQVVGAGATATSAVASLVELGARRVEVVARRPDAAGGLLAVAARLGVEVSLQEWSSAGLAAADVVVATTPPGATDPLAAGLGGAPGLLVDVGYAPWPSRLATAWQGHGGAVRGGLDLLVAQAVEQVRLMTGRDPSTAVMTAAGRAALGGSEPPQGIG